MSRRWRAVVVGAVLAAMLPVAGALDGTPQVSAAGDARYSSIPMRSWRVNGVGRSILKVGNTIYVGGSFSQALSPDGSRMVQRRNLAAFDATTGALIESFRADTDNAVYDIQTDGTSLFIAGVFTSASGASRARLAALDPATGALRPEFRADTNGNVYTMSLAGGKLYVAGAFTTIGGVNRTRVAALSPTTGAVDPTFRPVVDGTALAVAATPDARTVYIGGPYSTVNGQADTDISTLDGTTGATIGPELQNVTGYVDDLEVTPDGQFLMAGHSGVPGVGNRSAVYSTVTGSRRWRQLVDGDVQGVALIDGRVFTGFHDGGNGDGSTRLAAYDLTSGAQDTTFRPSFNRFMGAWAVDGDTSAVVIAGNFSIISGVPVEGFAIFPAATPTEFSGAIWGWDTWKYLDDGSNQGTAWRQPGFDDSAWKSGIGEFGYGDGDERTRISFGGSASGKHITSYFRREFDVTSVPASAGIYMRVDDGAVVYVNGVEAARYNMPAGTTTSSTRASSAHDGDGEDDSLYFAIDPGLLRPGTNTIAVEIHQVTPDSNDLTFFATVTAYRSSVIGAPAPTTTTTPPTTLPPLPPATGGGINVAPTATWSYLDNGADLGTAWQGIEFNDGAWKTGVGEFGYGDGDERTVVSYGPNAATKHPTTYFRHRFTAIGTPADLTLLLRVDDGAVAYLNGHEVARVNMPAGPINVNTRAPAAFSGTDETRDRRVTIDPSLIRAGTNVLAVEVHQNTLGSSDLSFLASLSGAPGAGVPTTTAPPATTTTTSSTTSSTTSTTTTSTTTTVAPTTVAPTTPPTSFAAFDLAASATWSYLDDGSDQGSAWRNPGFDASTWRTGIGEFGYGDGDERTLVGFGPDPSRKYPTTYFRTNFTTSGVPRTLTLSLRIDDGAIVWVNGVEAMRFNMPTTGVNHLTRADEAIANGGERMDRPFTLDPTLIRPGANVIAVEVHQDTYGSSDITFLASLAGRS